MLSITQIQFTILQHNCVRFFHKTTKNQAYYIKNTNTFKMKKTILFINILLAFNTIFADNTPDTTGTDAYIIGHVISNGNHIPNIAIIIKGTNILTNTNATGHYEIFNAPVGQITIIARGVGFVSNEKTIIINNDQTIELNFELQADHINIDQIVVSANKTETNRSNAPMLVNVISPKLISTTGAVCGADILSFQPGLRVETNCQNCGFTQLRMNGMEGAYSQILINSRPIFSALNGVYGLEQIPAQMIDRIEIVRGGGSALFGGNAIAGTVNIITKEPTSNTYQIGSNLAMIDGKVPDYNIGFNSSIVTDDLKTGLFIFGIKRNRQPFFANNDNFSEIPLIKSNAFGFSAFHKITSQSKISIDFHNLKEFRRGGDQFNSLPHLTNITEQVDHDIIGGGINFDYLSKNYKTKLSLFTSGQHTLRESYYGADQDPAAYGLSKDFSWVTGAQFSHQLILPISPINLVMGVENVYSKLNDIKLGYFDYNSNEKIGDITIADQEIITPGAYLQTEWDINFMKLLVGARYDIPDKKLDIGAVFMPRANILINIRDYSKLRLSYAKGYRSPQIFDEDLHIEASGARKHVHAHSDNLTAEFSNSFSGSIDFTKYLNNVQTYFLVEFFYTMLKNPFSNEYLFDEETETLTLLKVNSTSGAYVQGLNFESKFAFSKNIELQAGGTIQKSLFEEAQPWGEDEMLTTKKFLRTPDKYGYVVFNYNPHKNTNISLTGNYTGTMLTPHLSGGLNPDGFLITEDILHETQDFFDAAINISQTFKITDEAKIQVNAGVKNIFNSYQSDFDMGVNRDAGFIYGPLLPRTFMIGIKLGNF